VGGLPGGIYAPAGWEDGRPLWERKRSVLWRSKGEDVERAGGSVEEGKGRFVVLQLSYKGWPASRPSVWEGGCWQQRGRELGEDATAREVYVGLIAEQSRAEQSRAEQSGAGCGKQGEGVAVDVVVVM
jgi:hypothetical protein